jgi:hypothetical protein
MCWVGIDSKPNHPLASEEGEAEGRQQAMYVLWSHGGMVVHLSVVLVLDLRSSTLGGASYLYVRSATSSQISA